MFQAARTTGLPWSGLKGYWLPNRCQSMCRACRCAQKQKRYRSASPGSPTVRVNGRDVEPNAIIVPGLACRLYANGLGVPSEEMVRAAISEAKRRE